MNPVGRTWLNVALVGGTINMVATIVAFMLGAALWQVLIIWAIALITLMHLEINYQKREQRK